MKITGFKVNGLPPLERMLQQASSTRWEAVANKSLKEMFNRGGRPPGTPRDTGELIRARRIQLARRSGSKWRGSFGYSKDYGPHVEFGHRTRGGGYVAGRRYLKNNVEAQKIIYKSDILKQLKELKK